MDSEFKLSIVEPQLHHAGLVHLKGLTKLEWLGLNDTQVTAAGVAELQQALPDCKIKK